jgi:sec-independent protein translocase protein TatA
MELVIVLVIALVILGPKRLPDAGKAVGKGMREFKESLSGRSDDDDVDTSHITAATRAD